MLRRHELLGIGEGAWRAVLGANPALTSLPAPAAGLVAGWAAKGWPVMVRRPMAGDAPDAVSACLALPPRFGKLRLAFGLPKRPALARRGAVLLCDARRAAPDAWHPAIDALLRLGDEAGSPPGVFGALLWQHLTGLSYLGPHSDLDLLWPVSDRRTAAALLPALRLVEQAAPMRLDGEAVLPDGAGVNWRELAGALDRGGGEVLAKAMHAVESRPLANLFASEGAR